MPDPTHDPSSVLPPTGLLLIDKPPGPTSMTVCRRIRAALVRAGAPKRVKVGHAGTLDPFASGLLIIMTGRATKLCDQFMVGEKRYTATVDLSAFSTTDDTEGERTELDIETPPTFEAVRTALDNLTGEIQQRPPAHSAIWVDGKRAYELARAGELDQLPARPVTVHSIDIEHYAFPELVLDIRCGKGVYIRSIARDLGHALSTGGTLIGLRRTQIGRFDVNDALELDNLPEQLTRADLMRTPEVDEIYAKFKG